ncbi:MAG: histidine kinase dimerization/phospho-acceptor domain-containing protein [Anaerolineales bacterium]|nr:histidine kinase dimerization/phospho-acceptor domain-containing protein [Anaerolineales bacterium]
MDKTILEIPTELLQAAKITAEEAKTELAIRLYQQHRLNEEQAKELAGDPNEIEVLVWGSHETGRIDLDDFISWAAHDLKSPLNTIIGFTRVVMKGMDGPVNETQIADLTTAFTGSQRMLFLLNNLVDMARLNIGHIHIERVEENMTNTLAEALERWKTANPAKPVTQTVHISNPIFNVDAAHLRQAISSMLTYASLRVTEGALTLSASDDENGLRVSIQSAGQKLRDKSEMDSAMLDFICSSLIKLHGGNFDPPQETEDGLALCFSLPRAESVYSG